MKIVFDIIITRNFSLDELIANMKSAFIYVEGDVVKTITAIIRPTLEYCDAVWSLQLYKDVEKL